MDSYFVTANIREWIKNGQPVDEQTIKKDPHALLSKIALGGKKTKSLSKLSASDATAYVEFIVSVGGIVQEHIRKLPEHHRELLSSQAHLVANRLTVTVSIVVLDDDDGISGKNKAIDCMVAINNVEEKTEEYFEKLAEYLLCIGANIPLPIPDAQPPETYGCNAEKGSLDVAANDLNKAIRDMKFLCGLGDI